MKNRRILAGLAIAGMLMICACVSKGVIPAHGPGQDLLVKAESRFKQGFYSSAVTYYQDYLHYFPNGDSVPTALLGIGDVFSAQGEYDDARRHYSLLVDRFPENTAAEDARIGILLSWYKQRQYARAIDYANTITDKDVSDDCLARKYAIVSDAYLALGEPVDAAYVLISGLKKVDGAAQNKILMKLGQVSGKIGPESLQKIMAAVKDPDFRGFLSCQIAERYIQNQNYEQAVMILSGFLTAFPNNAYAQKAVELLRRIDTTSVYERYAIGCLLPLSGKYRLFGERALKGIQFAFQEFLTAHSGNGVAPPIRLIIEDTGSNARKAVNAAKALADKKVAAIIGPLLPFKEAILEADKHRIPIITICQDQNIPKLGEYVFRNFLTPQMQVESLVKYTCDDLGMRKFAVLYPEEEYGRVFAHKFWDEILKYDGEMVGFESYNPSDTDFAEPIKKLAGLYYEVPEDLKEVREQRLIRLGLKEVDTGFLDAFLFRDLPAENTENQGIEEVVIEDEVNQEDEANEEGLNKEEDPDSQTAEEEAEEEDKALVDFDALFVPDGPTNVGMIIPQLAFYDIIDTLLLGTNLWYSRELIETAGGYAQGAVFPADFLETGGRQAAAGSFSSRYELFYNEKPGFVSAVAYDTAVILMRIINDPAIRFRHSIIERLENMEGFPGVTGETAFDLSGEVRKKLTLLKIKRNGFAVVADRAAAYPEKEASHLENAHSENP